MDEARDFCDYRKGEEIFRFLPWLLILFVSTLMGCIVDGRCLTAEDCEGAEVCIEGHCILECSTDADCAADKSCRESRCVFAEGCLGCPYPNAPQAIAQCVHGVCSIVSCDSGWYDADNDPKNGCECQITLDGNEACDGKDNDCNGQVDEGCECTPTNGGVEICDGIDNDCDRKVDEGLLCCPDDMVPIGDGFCIDRYEASRPDATDEKFGTDSSIATSRPNVMPWAAVSLEDAQAACEAAGKRLCNPGEWESVCKGPNHSTYCYGDEYEAATCNGIDAFCEVPEYGCGRQEYKFKLVTTGAFPDCTNSYGVFDINGNLWEWDSNPDGTGRGGAYNCSDSRELHRCEYLKRNGPGPSNNIGFRCCR